MHPRDDNDEDHKRNQDLGWIGLACSFVISNPLNTRAYEYHKNRLKCPAGIADDKGSFDLDRRISITREMNERHAAGDRRLLHSSIDVENRSGAIKDGVFDVQFCAKTGRGLHPLV